MRATRAAIAACAAVCVIACTPLTQEQKWDRELKREQERAWIESCHRANGKIINNRCVSEGEYEMFMEELRRRLGRF